MDRSDLTFPEQDVGFPRRTETGGSLAVRPNDGHSSQWGPHRTESDMSRNEAFQHLGTVNGIDLVATDNLPAIAETWLRFQETAWHTPFQDFHWLAAWHESRGRNSRWQARVVFGYEASRLRFILPLAVNVWNGVVRLSWMASDVNDYNCPLIDPAFVARLDQETGREIWCVIARAKGGIDSFHLKTQPSEIAGHPNPFLVAGATVPSACDSHLLSLQKDWKALHASLRGTKSRRRLREKLNRMRKAGAVRFRCVRGAEERRRAVEHILSWKSDQLHRSGDRNVFADTAHGRGSGGRLRQTIETNARSDAALRRMRVYGLYLDETMIAGLIAFVDRSSFSMFVTALDPRTPGSFSAGTILLVKSLELAARGGLKRFDFLAGDEAYKFDWCNRRVRLMDSYAGTTLPGRIDASVCRLRLAVKKRVKANTGTMALLRHFNRGLRRFLQQAPVAMPR